MCENEPQRPRITLKANIERYLAAMEAMAKRADDERD